MKSILAVIGPHSELGKSVISALEHNSEWNVRPVSRSSAFAANLQDIDALTAAFSGVEAVFLHLPVNLANACAKEEAVQYGKNVALACRAAGVRRLIYSTALSPLPMMGIAARHLDARAELDSWLRKSAPWIELICIMVPITYQTLTQTDGVLSPQHVNANLYRLAVPVGKTPIDIIDIEDAGRVVKQILLQPKRFLNKTLALSRGKVSVANICDIFNKHFVPAQFYDSLMTLQEFRSLPLAGAADVANAFEFLVRVDQQYNSDITLQLVPHALTLDQWVYLNKKAISAACGLPLS